MLSQITLALSLLASCNAFSLNNNNNNPNTNLKIDSGRRQLLQHVAPAAALAILFPQNANAGIDPNALKGLRVEGDNNGAAQRLREINGVQEADKTRPEDLVDIPYEKFPDGVSFRYVYK